MQLPSAVLVLLVSLLLAARAQERPQPAAGGNTASSSCIPLERDALLAFKHGVTSDPAGLLSSWRRDGGSHGEQDCCRWRGVRCSNQTGHVHKLTLQRPGDQASSLVGEISPSLLDLQHLEHLDLSRNYDLGGSTGRLPEFLGSLKSLTYLNLSGINFDCSLPPQLGNLSKLQYLDLSSMGDTNSTDLSWLTLFTSIQYLDLCGIGFHGSLPSQLGNLTKLQHLDLSNTGATSSADLSWLTRLPSLQYLNLKEVNLSAVVDWPHVMNMIPSLRVLRLSGCSLASANISLPHSNLTNLEELDASYNDFNHPMSTSWFRNITRLKYLSIDISSLYGQPPDALGDMTSLKVLDISPKYYNYGNDDNENMGVVVTMDLKNFCNLEVLSLAGRGDVTDLFKNLPRCSPNKLQELYLGWNQLSGMLPRWIGRFTSLVVLDLSCNNITGSLPASLGRLTSLQTLDLSQNYLTGHVPSEIGMLSNLTSLCLNDNHLDGVITELHFASARRLQYIDLSYNALKIEVSSEWQPKFRLNKASFAACQMGPLFPGWLQWQVGITDLDISSAGIADRLPQWFSDAFSNVEYLNISNNQLNGALPTDMGSMSLCDLYLSANQLTGQISTVLPPNISILDLSINSLSGPLPSGSGSEYLSHLSLFSNQITGHIPESFCKYQLALLDLSNNFLEGELPTCLGEMEDMEFIALRNNSLSGELPSFIQNFTSILFLDLSRNKFSGRLPMWIGNFVQLRVLRLSHNKFSGNIPVNITNLVCLQYMDLNNNEISGSLPRYLSNLKMMTKKYKAYVNGAYDGGTYVYGVCEADSLEVYPISLFAFWKGQEQDYGSIARVVSTNMTSIDLSSNNLTGEIPEEITALDALMNLNLSRNHFSGVVPNKIGEMQSLEALDLSRNRLSGKIPTSLSNLALEALDLSRNMLSGEIPTSLSNLTFLSSLDLSYNNLTGTVPSGTQLDTLYAGNPSMYTGNIGLCGHPLPNNCPREGDAPKQSPLGRTEEADGIEFFYIGLGCGFVVGTWVAFGVLLFKRSWRVAYFQLPDKLYDKLYVLVATTWARQPQTDYDEAAAMVGSSTRFSQGMHE